MYAENPSNESLSGDLSMVAIAPIEDRIGQVVRNHLLDRMNPYGEPGAPDFQLHVTLVKTIEGYGFRTDEAITRESLTMTANFRLIEQSSGKVVLEDQVRAVQSYDIVQSDFANFSAQQDAEARTAQLVAELLTTRVGIYFKKED